MTRLLCPSKTIFFLLTMPLLLSSSEVFAAVPDAGTLLQEFQQITPPPLPKLAPKPKVKQEQTLPPKDKNARIHIYGYEIQSKIFPPDELVRLLADTFGKDLTFAELQAVARRISDYYRDHNYHAQAIIPVQKIEDDIIRIVVLESTLGQIKIDSDPDARVNTDFARDVVSKKAPAGRPLRPDDLREGVARLNEIPGVSAVAELEAGANDRETDVIVRVTDTALVTSALQVNNESSRSVGSLRAIASSSLNNATGMGDQTSLLLVKSAYSTYGRVAMTLPVHASGFTVGVNSSALSYEVDSDFSSIDQDGYAFTGGLTGLYALTRKTDHSINLTAAYDYKRLENSVVDLNSSSKEIHVGNFGISALFADHLLAGGTTSLNASVTAGFLNLHGNESSYTQDQASARTNGMYKKLNLTVSRLQSFDPANQLFVSFHTQLASKNLDSSEQISLGGPQGVRAYPANEAMGDQGILSHIEFRHRVKDWIQLYDFYDAGWIQQHKNIWTGWNSGSATPNNYWLQGIGIGVKIQPFEHALIDATLAKVIGSNAGETDGKDSDGYDRDVRFWLRASLTF